MRRAAALLLLAFLSFGCPARTSPLLPRPVELSDREAAQVPAARLFPEHVGEFRRVDITKYDEAGTNISAGYQLQTPRGQIAATVYRYPGPQMVYVGADRKVVEATQRAALEKHFSEVQVEITRAHPYARLLSEDELMMTNSGREQLVMKSSYRYPTIPPVHSQIYLFIQDRKWFVKYRVTASVPLEELEEHMHRLISKVPR
jgi:hypothetical protein